ncbi:hypothetical protein EMIT079MI2_240032 [Bacillus sp. IT-79MI2]
MLLGWWCPSVNAGCDPIIVYAGYPNEMQAAEPDNSICVFVLKSVLKIEVLEGVNKSFRPRGLDGM